MNTRVAWSTVLLTAAAWGIGAGAAHARDDADIEPRVQACTACHGEQGRAGAETYAPSIAGKPDLYLYRQLLNFRDGRRQHAVMQPMLAYLSDDYLREIAAYYAAQRPALGVRRASASAPMLNLGRKLVEHGDPARHLPACRSCHGAELLGVRPAIPGLLALSSDYLTAQMGAWRAGTRAAAAPDCMAAIAMKLTPQEIGAVTAWVASRPVPERHEPAAELPEELPIACGAVQ